MAKQTFTTGQVLTAAQMTSLQQTAMGGGSTTAKTASYTLVAADAGTVIQMNSASATTITVNTALFAAGDTVQIQNIGAGVCTVTAGTATVSTAGSLALSQYEGGQLYFNTTSAAIFFDLVQSGSSGMSWASVLTRTTIGTGTSFTASSLSGYNQLMIFLDGVGNNGTTGKYTITFNSDTSSSYFFTGGGYSTGFPSTTGSGNRYYQASATTSIDFQEVAQGTSLDGSGVIHILGANTTAIKTGLLQSGMEHTANTTDQKYTRTLNFRYSGGSVISSFTITATAGNFNNGFCTIIGSVN